MPPKYHHIELELSGHDGNAFMIIGRATKAMRRNHVSTDEIAKFTEEVMSGDYDNVLRTCMRWFTCK